VIGLGLENFSPLLDFKDRLQQLRWIGHGCDSDAELATLYEYWLVNHNGDLFDSSTGSSAVIPPPRMHVQLVVIAVVSSVEQMSRFYVICVLVLSCVALCTRSDVC